MPLTQEEVFEVAEDPSKLRLTPDPTKLMRETSTEPVLETIPCHTQPVERMIGFVTKVSANYPAGDGGSDIQLPVLTGADVPEQTGLRLPSGPTSAPCAQALYLCSCTT